MKINTDLTGVKVTKCKPSKRGRKVTVRHKPGLMPRAIVDVQSA